MLTLLGVIDERVANFDSSCFDRLLPGHKAKINWSHGNNVSNGWDEIGK